MKLQYKAQICGFVVGILVYPFITGLYGPFPLWGIFLIQLVVQFLVVALAYVFWPEPKRKENADSLPHKPR